MLGIDKLNSEEITNFLAFIRNAEQLVPAIEAAWKLADDESQDILHAIEFHNYNPRKTSALVKKLQTVRAERRIAKNAANIAHLITDWSSQNQQALKALERLLGDVRKEERHIQNMVYVPRTNIMEESGEENNENHG